mmetsp:Transcript_6763/g.8846  ORF Transcript_6763/g.8846 Transcript_6763/m.8846 type:complete len:160 (+) Transcript_6763:200-679(+)
MVGTEARRRVRWEYKTKVRGLNPEETQKEFTRIQWRQFDGGIFSLFPPPGIKEEGDANGVGCVRIVPFEQLPIMEEEILDVTPGEEIVYTVNKGPFPVYYHRGYVTFEPTGSNSTLVKWAVEVEPYPYCETILKYLVMWIFTSGLQGLKNGARKPKKDN